MFMPGISGIIPGTTNAVVVGGDVPSFRSAGGIGSTIGAVFDVPFPSGVQADDILLFHISITDNFGNADVTSLSDAGFALVDTTFSSDTRSSLYWKRATGLESGNLQVTLSETTSSGIAGGVVSAWPGCIATGTPYESATINAVTSASTSIAGSAVGTTGPNRLVVSFFDHDSVLTTGTNTNGWDEVYDVNTVDGLDITMAGCSIEAPSAGTVSACTRTLANSAANICHTLALLPA